MRLPSDRQVDALTAVYRDAETRLTLQVERALTSGQLGTATYRQAQLQQVLVLLGQLHAAATPQAVATVQASYQEGIQIANLAGIRTSFSGIHREAVSALTQSLNGRLGDGMSRIGRQVDDMFRHEGSRLAVLHLAEGSTRAEASTDMAQSLTRQGVSAFTDRAGRDWGLPRYTEMAIRTTTREAVSQGTRNRLVEGGLDLVEWDGNGENCDECAALDGTVYSLTGATDGYPMLEQMPPLHPNCTCVLTPSSVTFETLERELGVTGG